MRLEKGMILPLQLVLPDIGALEAVELCDSLGSGAFGHVWKVRPVDSADTEKTWLGFGRPRKKKGVAANTEDYYVLKYIKAESDSHAERVRREANAGTKIASKHVVCCYGCQEVGANQFVLLFPYERGKNLAEWLAANPQASWLKKRQIFLDILDGVRALHHAGIIHRDLKPENIFVTLPYHDPRIIDFGLAKFRDLERMTPSGGQIGTLLYMPPEVRWFDGGSDKADERHDLYALGIILYEIALGQHPRHARLPHISSDNILQAKHLLEISAFEFADDPRAAEAIRACTMTDPNARLRRVDDLIAILDGQPQRVSDIDDLSELTILPDAAPAKSAATPQKPAQTPRIVVTQERKPETKAEPKTPKVGDSWTEPTTGMIFMYIPAGRFMMGQTDAEQAELIKLVGKKDYQSWYANELPRHEVTFKDGFWMGTYPVTQAEWQTIMGKNPSYFKGERRPVETVSWDDCQKFLKKLNDTHPLPLPRGEQRGIPLSGGAGVGSPLLGGAGGGLLFRLPSEAEWEYACRAGTTTPFYFGETISADQANYNGNYVYGKGKQGVYRKQTTDVGSFSPNAWGLCDMHGNVWEWCADTWHESYKEVPNNGNIWGDLGDKKAKVLRGGSWYDNPSNCRSAFRGRNVPDKRFLSIGARVVVGAR